MTAPALADPKVSILPFETLQGWAADDHSAALGVFRTSCKDLPFAQWGAVCDAASRNPDPRRYFETWFRPVLIEDDSPGLFTGYYEPELPGARERSEQFRYPIYAIPVEAREVAQWRTRQEIDESGILEGHGLELAWLDDPVEVFFLQVQGSGRIRLEDGTTMRVGFAGKNGHPYRSIGKEMKRRGFLGSGELTAEGIKDWLRRHPEARTDVFHHNPSFVFFREIRDHPADLGPIGAMNHPLTPLRSLAVDPDLVPLGAPIWIEKAGKNPMSRLLIAQDTGSAIKGAQRADIFFGSGATAGAAAGQISDPGRMVVLLPKQMAEKLVKEGPS